MTENEIAQIIVDASIQIHKELGPGLFESVYEVVLKYELESNDLLVDRQVSIPIEYKGIKFQQGFVADLIVENKVIIELKSLETVSKAHKKQVLTYLRLTGKKLGFLLNFGEALMKNGITRIINGVI